RSRISITLFDQYGDVLKQPNIEIHLDLIPTPEMERLTYDDDEMGYLTQTIVTTNDQGEANTFYNSGHLPLELILSAQAPEYPDIFDDTLDIILTQAPRPYLKLTKSVVVTRASEVQNDDDEETTTWGVLAGAVGCLMSFMPWYMYVLAVILFIALFWQKDWGKKMKRWWRRQ
ncbi:MAG: hypothetical protein PHS07_03995, partial [Patescibacteria group bacterium]|nr:hypothetical protein [Patescibacteria group bacterium]